jgi:hypothetical protein
MKPRYEAASPKAYEMLRKAEEIAARLDTLEKEAKCPSCGMKKMDCMMKTGCASMKKAEMAEKDKYCMKHFGKKHSECSDKQKAQCDKAHGKVAKGTHHKETSFGTQPEGVQFNIETGGQTYNAFYHTNQSLLDSEDIANKGASSESVNLDTLKVNTHDTVDRLVEG